MSDMTFLGDAVDLLTGYAEDREKTLTRQEREIAALRVRCEEAARRADLLEQFTRQFFEERQKIRSLVMKSLNIAIAKGDADISAIALAILGREHSKDFFGAMNKIAGLR